MAGVEGMAFSAGRLPQSANKEKGGFWPDLSFDQWVELGDSDPESASGGGGGFGHFGGASGLSASPHLSSGQMLSPGGAQGAAAQGQFSAGNHNNSNNAAGSGSPIRRPGHHQTHSPHPQDPQATVNMAALSNNHDIDVDGLPYGSFGEVPSGGSFSDSELLNFGGLRMGSPRIQLPQLSASEPASPPSKATSPPRKASSRLGKFCAKVRNKATALQGKKTTDVKPEPEPDSSLGVPVMSTAQLEPAKTTPARPRPQNVHIPKAQSPSPPLTSGMPGEAQQAVAGSEASAVNGFLDDPFFSSSQFVPPPPLQLNGSAMPQTPLSTPHMDGSWQMAVSMADGKTLWTTVPGAYFGHNGDANTMWDTTSSDAMDTDPPPMSYHTANAHNTSANYAIQPGFQYPPPPENTTINPNGLHLHMPQPHGIPPALLQQNDNNNTTSHRPTRADGPHHQQQHRRPKPRAPSSGARHHHHHHQYGGPAGISPRKGGRGRAVSGSGSASRIASVSPSPKMMPASASAAAAGMPGGLNGTSRTMLHRRSASMQTLTTQSPAGGLLVSGDGAAISKRRSWTGRRMSSSSSSTSLRNQYNLAVAAAAEEEQEQEEQEQEEQEQEEQEEAS
ncbi:hypothetical protein C8A01DRAFT_48327 [Parachaetomium inaequale]|uniref:Uncharacterized protein n=1 Tax=Parachaetomium inaequale TaxID=2588326 RepID=A0AAN6SQ72_9PEZI|nr:hypothetical protein C8A01DRAFT_48327 [Parachaetomium inaequale]